MGNFSIVVLFSGTGSTFNALIKQQQHYKIVASICNRPKAAGIKLATANNIPCHIIDHTNFAMRGEFDAALCSQIASYQPDLIVLAGFMRRLGSEFINAYAKKIINIHPSLLPKYPGLNTYARVLASTDKFHGTTIHYVTAAVDQGPIIAQAKTPILATDTVESLSTRVKCIEQQMYPEIIDLICKKQLSGYQPLYFAHKAVAKCGLQLEYTDKLL